MSLLPSSWHKWVKMAFFTSVEQGEKNHVTAAPPVVSASGSGDTFTDDDRDGGSGLTEIIPAAYRRTPSTPNGLKPRRPLKDIKEELKVQSLQGQERHTSLVSTKACYHTSKSIPLLPPRPSDSWSIQGVLSSPPVSTSSFYSRDGSGMGVATSPHLLPGKARTAVGALVASSTAATQNAPRHNGSLSRHQVNNSWSQRTMYALPDWRDRDDYNDDNDQNINVDVARYVPLPDDVVPSARMPSFALPELCPGNSHSPPSSPPSSSKSLNSVNSSLLVSPSSLAHDHYCARKDPSKQYLDTSFSSQARLIPATSHYGQKRHHTYDFAPVFVSDGDQVAGTEVVLLSNENINNLSGISHSAVDQDSVYDNCRAVCERSVDGSNYHNSVYNHVSNAPLDGSLMRQKSLNQRRFREDLFVAVLERLQDESSLIAEVENVHCRALLDDLVTKTPMNEEGILTGFLAPNRSSIVHNLSAVLNEMNVAPGEEFLMSPSEISRYAITHNDLQDALIFCRKLVEMAIPEQEMERGQGRWKFQTGLRSALGLIQPESPDIVRGGDTSFFSLPSDSAETPMTSNVSVTTTITSAVTSPFGGARDRSLGKYPGLQLRRTIEIVAALLQKLTTACLRLKSNGSGKWNLSALDSIRVTEDIKRAYLQIQAINVRDLKALVDAFNLETFARPLVREVSSDDDDIPLPAAMPHILPPVSLLTQQPYQLQRHYQVLNPRQNNALQVRERDCRHRSILSIGVNSDPGFFSPSSDDLQSWADKDEDKKYEDKFEFDDLRRQIGSNDYEDIEDEREEPECDERENCEGRNTEFETVRIKC